MEFGNDRCIGGSGNDNDLSKPQCPRGSGIESSKAGVPVSRVVDALRPFSLFP